MPTVSNQESRTRNDSKNNASYSRSHRQRIQEVTTWRLENYDNDPVAYQKTIDNLRKFERLLDDLVLCEKYDKLDKEIKSIFTIAREKHEARNNA